MSVHPINPTSTEPLRTSPRVEIDLMAAVYLHRAMVKAYRDAQALLEQARTGYHDALNVVGDARIALAHFEPYLAELEDQMGFRNLGRTDFITLDEVKRPVEPGEGA